MVYKNLKGTVSTVPFIMQLTCLVLIRGILDVI